MCLCKNHRQFFRGELSEENPGIPLHIVENFGIIHGVVTCPWIVKHSGNRAALKKVTEKA